MMIQPGIAPKLRRVEQGKQSSLCDLRGSYLAERILNSSETELKAEKPESICLILRKLAGYSALLTSTQVERIVSVMLEVVAEKGEKAVEAFDFFIKKAPKPASLSLELNHKVDELFLQKNLLYLSIIMLGPGNNFGSLFLALCKKNEPRVLELLKTLDFSFVQPRIPTLLVEGFEFLTKKAFKKLLLKLSPSPDVIEKLILEKELEHSYFEIVDVMIKMGFLKRPQIQELYDFSVRASSASWMAYFGTRGASNSSQGAPHPTPRFEPTPDSNVEEYFRKTEMLDDFSSEYADESKLKQITHNSLKVYKHHKPSLYYFILAKRVSLVWGFCFGIKNPFSNKLYAGGFTTGLSRLFWVDALKTFPERARHPYLEQIIKIIYNTRNLDSHNNQSLKRALQDINKGKPVLINSGYNEHFAAEFFNKESYAYCDRSSSDPGIIQFHRNSKHVISKQLFDRLIAEKNLPKEMKMDMDERAVQLELDNEVHLEMKAQASENCTVASYDAVLFHLLSELSPFRDENEIRLFYKSLTQHLRRETLYVLFDDVLSYLNEPRNREVSQLLYTLIAGIFIKLSKSPLKLSSEEEAKHLVNMSLYLMKRLES